MKRVLLGLGTAAVVLTAVASSGVAVAAPTAHAARPTARRVCTTGPERCLAMIAVTPAGKVISAARPAALPAGLSPAQLHKAYNLPVKAPAGATVAVVGAFDAASVYADLTAYSKKFALPVLPQCTTTVTTACFQKTNLGAAAGSAAKPGWDVETSLDVESVHAVCQTCKIVLVEAKNDGLAALLSAETAAGKQASIVSNSWGSTLRGGLGSKTDAVFNQPKHAVIAASGDDGYGASYPAVLNTVISVGGTSLTTAADGTYRSEKVWSRSGSGCATGGGGSAAVAPAAFQKAARGFSTAGCPAGIRGDNDVAAVADPATGLAVYTSRLGWIQVGGTSLAAPVIAGVYALAGNVTGAALPASYLYSHLGTGAFHDVTSGSNRPASGCDGVTARCTGRTGFDLPTGVGTPNGIAGF